MRALHRSAQSCVAGTHVYALVEDSLLNSAAKSARYVVAELQSHRCSLSRKGLLKKEQVQRFTRAGSGGLHSAESEFPTPPLIASDRRQPWGPALSPTHLSVSRTMDSGSPFSLITGLAHTFYTPQ